MFSVWAVALALSAPPGPLRLSPKSAAVVQSGWEYVKEVKTLSDQEARIDERHLNAAYCDDTLSAGELIQAAALPYELRDLVRLRHEARPEMIALLLRAMDNLRRVEPRATITIGDIAQAGCGQIRYGAIVSFETFPTAGVPAAARIEFGLTTELIPHEPEDFLDEFPRYADSLGPVWMERTVTGATPDGRLRIESRRFEGSERLGPDSVDRLLQRATQRFRSKETAWDIVVHTLPDGRVATVRRGTWHSDTDGRWSEIVLAPGRASYPLRAERVLRIREAMLDAGKPTSLKFEERYLFDDDGESGSRVTRFLLEYEAHHASHLGGLDADLSYVTHGNIAHFMPSLALLDRRGSWRWMKALHAASEDLGIPLKALFVDGVILRALKSVDEAGKRDPTWKKIHRAPGHDSHVHVRIGSSPRWAGKTLAQIIDLVRRR